ncbi:MAG TPA: Sjogren's syndrome/scleroderma autoantigen 1 family protein [Nitrososphaeraceae archaeon]|nr:Sjogren's syndrome/scleroderma autoantigen 1 family protein [Nitrososphaeraceae archaeon]
MSSESKDRVDKSSDIKNAAALLLKGGSLLSEPCGKCGGLQVKFKEKTTCVNCGNKQDTIKSTFAIPPEKEYVTSYKSRDFELELENSEHIIKNKILMLSRELKDENELEIQKQKVDLIEGYFRILQMIRILRNDHYS